MSGRPSRELIHERRSVAPEWSPVDSGWRVGTNGFGWVLYVTEGGNSSVQVRDDEQPAPRRLAGESSETWTWNSVVSETGTVHAITVVMSLTRTGSSIAAELHVANDADVSVDSALFPWIRGFAIPAERALSAMTRDYYGAAEHPLWPTFEWNKGYYGTYRPTLMTESLVFGNPTAPFTVMLDGVSALAVTVAGPTPEITSWMWELDPGYADAIGDHVPLPLNGIAAELRFSAVHLLDLAPGESRQLSRIDMSHSIGGWQEALAAYREDRVHVAAAVQQRATPSWAQHSHTWYQIQLGSPVGEARYRFSDLPALAAECVEAGVAVLHVIGWNEGGQDRNNPSHDADPELGGPEELATAISACQALGVKVVLFAKFTWADLSTERFRSELVNSAVIDPYGDFYQNGGYQYLTPHQLMGVSTRRLIPMCYQHEDYLRICEEEFDKIVASGADGMLFDETMHHTPALQCYSPSHGHRVGASVYAADNELADRLRKRVPEGREFLFAGETVYEDLQSSYDVSYIRSHYTAHQPLTRYVNPGLRMMTTVSGFDDRNQINQALAYGYLLCYEPFHFKGRLHDFPQTTAYGRLVEAVRVELAEYLWDGLYLGDVPAARSNPLVASARWQSTAGRIAYVFANFDQSTEWTLPTTELIGATQWRGLDQEWQPLTPTTTVGPRAFVVVR
jgi:hypothetical protein